MSACTSGLHLAWLDGGALKKRLSENASPTCVLQALSVAGFFAISVRRSKTAGSMSKVLCELAVQRM